MLPACNVPLPEGLHRLWQNLVDLPECVVGQVQFRVQAGALSRDRPVWLQLNAQVWQTDGRARSGKQDLFMVSTNLGKPSTRQIGDLLGRYRSGNHKLTEDSARLFTQMFPDHVLGWKVLGGVLLQQSRPGEAVSALETATRLNSSDSETRSLLGLGFSMIGFNKQAEVQLNAAVELQSDNAEIHNNLGVVRRKLRKFDEALECFDKALALAPKYAGAMFNRATALNDMGEIEDAKNAYRETIALDDTHAGAYRQLAELIDFSGPDKLYRQMLKLFQSADLRQPSRIQLGFALAKANEDFSDFETAFSFYKTANESQKAALGYSIEDDKKLFARIEANHETVSKASVGEALEAENIPVFILGMPRSGTSLIEQILTSHSQVFGGGELSHVENLGFKLATGVERASNGAVLQFRNDYLKEIKEIGGDSPFVTDKMPLNFRYVGLICAAFPEARIIHVKRNPRAVCWAVYKQWFQAIGMKFCYDLTDVVDYYGLYDNMMAFWEKQLGQRISVVDYDDLTNNQVERTKDLIKHLGLPWEESCLRPEENRRAVSTASSNQVRKPVYKGSSKKWQAYEPFLGGVFDRL